MALTLFWRAGLRVSGHGFVLWYSVLCVLCILCGVCVVCVCVLSGLSVGWFHVCCVGGVYSNIACCVVSCFVFVFVL